MIYNELCKHVQSEISEVLNSIDENKINEFVDIILSSNKIIGYSAGRMGFGLKAFLMRLNHIGIPAFWFGDNYIPPMDNNDLFICCSNSGTTKSVTALLDIFKKKSNGKTVAFVGNLNSYMGQNVDLPILFKTCNGGLNSEDNDTKINSIQPMTTLSEQSMFILFDIVIMMIIYKKGINISDTKKYHSNIE